MRAAVLAELGRPEVGEFAEPTAEPGLELVQVLAAGLNPVDVAICAGRYYAGPPPVPSVAGREGVGIVNGERVYFDSPVPPFGSMAERTVVPAGSTHSVPDDVPDGLAVALGISGLAAWLSLTWRAKLEPGEHVLILGASGVVGQIAIQAARLLGAARVVGAARSRSGLRVCEELGADAVVQLDGREELAAAFRDACAGRIDVVVDPLCGEPLTAAVEAASVGARIVQLGQAAGPDARLSSAAIRGKLLHLIGHANFGVPEPVKREAYRALVAAGASGDVRVRTDPLPLAQVGEAWRRLESGSHRKILLLP